MNYLLQIVRGRSDTTNLKLAPGVNSIGRHDECLIRIRSAQVSRKHCEVIVADDKLVVRDLGSSNGTYVNGKRVLGQQALKPGDEVTIGGVTLRVGQLGTAVSPSRPSPVAGEGAASDTSEVEAIPAADGEDVEFALDDDEDFVVAIEDVEEAPEHMDIIPLDDEPAPPPKKPAAAPPKEAAAPPKNEAATRAPEKKEAEEPAVEPGGKPTKEEEDAVAQFLMDLKLDEE
ncbi:Glycogen accumulation regulator GarA [Aquisphaera giovannonii]|uniref:Glycogen accumulation regulator GarA n=1 Tax=Aquisphaera giovannonii TaxID=406548 RepID=A0A5B9VXB6_9BACT|nr:FHA domain-containing protein [Aquisphaera giovannonii]QEH32759.1 Glycogen accumulation regulator GarA [Aquisphaera giovannonii]